MCAWVRRRSVFVFSVDAESLLPALLLFIHPASCVYSTLRRARAQQNQRGNKKIPKNGRMGTAVKLAGPIAYKNIKMIPGELTGRGAKGTKK